MPAKTGLGRWSKSCKAEGMYLVMRMDGTIQYMFCSPSWTGHEVAFLPVKVPDAKGFFSKAEIKAMAFHLYNRVGGGAGLVASIKFLRFALGEGTGLFEAKKYWLKLTSGVLMPKKAGR